MNNSLAPTSSICGISAVRRESDQNGDKCVSFHNGVAHILHIPLFGGFHR